MSKVQSCSRSECICILCECCSSLGSWFLYIPSFTRRRAGAVCGVRRYLGGVRHFFLYSKNVLTALAQEDSILVLHVILSQSALKQKKLIDRIDKIDRLSKLYLDMYRRRCT